MIYFIRHHNFPKTDQNKFGVIVLDSQIKLAKETWEKCVGRLHDGRNRIQHYQLLHFRRKPSSSMKFKIILNSNINLQHSFITAVHECHFQNDVINNRVCLSMLHYSLFTYYTNVHLRSSYLFRYNYCMYFECTAKL